MRLLFTSLAMVLALLPLTSNAESYAEARRLIDSGQMTEGMCMMADLVRSGDSKARTLNDGFLRERGESVSDVCSQMRSEDAADAEWDEGCDCAASGTEDDPGIVAALRLGVSIACLIDDVINLFPGE